jgi:hypothetical protein
VTDPTTWQRLGDPSFEVRPASWTATIPMLPFLLGLAIGVWELASGAMPVPGLLVLWVGLVAAWLRESSHVRIGDGRLSMRWFGLTDRVVALDARTDVRTARTLGFALGPVNVLRLRDARGVVLDLPLDRWAHEPELRAIIAAETRSPGG